MKKLALLTIFCALATGTMAAPQDGWNEAMTVFKVGALENTEKPGKVTSHRIPAITTTTQGTIIAVSDIRYDGQHGNTDIADGGNNMHPVRFSVKISHDGGSTWSEDEIIGPTGLGNGYITDPSIVHDPETGKTFLFGYQNDKHLTKPDGNNKFFVYTSNDGGKTWDTGKEIQNDISLGDGYKYTLQGPGSGMSYNGNIYMAVQGWKPSPTSANDWESVSGFIYSDDNGKTWKTATLNGTLPPGVKTSESNIFYHKGKICLAAKVEEDTNNVYDKKRVVYTTDDNGKTWQKLEEDFLPDDVAKCETSSLSLSDDVYLVGYALQGKQPWDRNDIYVTTNTGRKIKLFEGSTKGYTSMAQDEDNLYILFEDNDIQGDKNEGQILFRRYDIASKEYANVNAQILERGQGLLDAQDKLFASRSYIGGEYANNSENGAEAVVLNGNYKIGAFHKKTTENSKDVYRTLEYKTEETTLVLSQDNVITKNDNIFIGYQYTDLEYVNDSKNDINSFVMGYSLNHNFENDYTYHFGINGIYSNNKLKRNDEEGVGRKADFDTYSISLRNELSKEFSLISDINTKVTFGLDTTVFGHDEIDEEGGIKTVDGGEWNNATVDKSKNISNELYAGTELNKNIEINEKLTLKFGADAEYRKELMDVDDWRDDFTVLDVTKKHATPVEKHEAGVFSAGISAGVDVADKVETTISYRMDSTGENIFIGSMTYKF